MAVGCAAGIVVVVAAVVAGHVAWTQRYWSAGYYRLIAEELCARFDLWIGPAAALALLATVAARRLLGVVPPRRLARWGLGGLAVVVALRGVVLVDRLSTRSGPNVVLISIDTLRADRLGSYGRRQPTSPNIDGRLAARGAVFERCLSQSPKTTPSHMTMLTSLYPCVHGVSLWEGSGPGPVLNPAVHTLAEALKNAGYATGAYTGRGHVHRSRGFGQGFDVYRHRRRYGNDPRGESRQLDEALAWLDRQQGGKFFLFFHTYAVHDPYLPPPELLALFDEDGYDGPLRDVVRTLRSGSGEWHDAHRVFWGAADTTDARAVRFLESLYDAVIRHADQSIVGALLDRLQRLGLDDRTLVVLTSDHGEAFGEHGRFLHGDLHVETLHVPLILRFPGRVPQGLRVTEPVRLLDLMPTVLDLVGVPAPADVQGRSLVPSMAGGRQERDRPVASEFNDGRGAERLESLRRGGLTYIVDGARERVFDHEADPGEQRDLAARRDEDRQALRDELAAWRAECERVGAALRPGGEGVAPSPETLEQLRALGYVE
jgi:arylsulfatase A-like enzyme